jgi:hypothetical protein
MAIIDMLLQDWQLASARAVEALPEPSNPARQLEALSGLGGPSPGGAAAELDLTRERIYQLVRLGRLDMVRIRDRKGAAPYIAMITHASIERFKRSKPGSQVDLFPAKLRPKMASRVRGRR